jgi:hypothetical protein
MVRRVSQRRSRRINRNRRTRRTRRSRRTRRNTRRKRSSGTNRRKKGYSNPMGLSQKALKKKAAADKEWEIRADEVRAGEPPLNYTSQHYTKLLGATSRGSAGGTPFLKESLKQQKKRLDKEFEMGQQLERADQRHKEAAMLKAMSGLKVKSPKGYGGGGGGGYLDRSPRSPPSDRGSPGGSPVGSGSRGRRGRRSRSRSRGRRSRSSSGSSDMDVEVD